MEKINDMNRQQKFAFMFSYQTSEGGDIGLFIILVYKVYNNVWFNNFGDFYWILIGWFITLSVHLFQPLIVIYFCVSKLGMYINFSAIVLSL